MGKLDHGTMCIMCQTLPLSKPRTSAHPSMTALTPKEDFGEWGIQRLYTCSVCHTHWLYQQDKWQACLGFKLWSGTLNTFLSQDNRPVSQPHTLPMASTSKGAVRFNQVRK